MNPKQASSSGRLESKATIAGPLRPNLEIRSFQPVVTLVVLICPASKVVRAVPPLFKQAPPLLLNPKPQTLNP